MLKVTALAIYPIKACRGISLTEMSFDELGPRWDRRWMVVDSNGDFVTQRTQRELASVSVAIDETTLSMSAPGMPPLSLATRSDVDVGRSVVVWGYRGQANDCGDAAADWLSKVVDAPVRLVQSREDDERWVSAKHCPEPRRVAFADGYPVLLTTEESRQRLEQRCGMPLANERFRPNIVVSGASPFAEDTWKRLLVGGRVLEVRKPCERCVVINIDPDTLESSARPLRALADLTPGRGATFGQNCTVAGTGVIRVGDVARVPG